MKKIIFILCICCMGIGCRHVKESINEEVVVQYKGDEKVSISNRSCLWKRPAIKMELDSLTGMSTHQEKLNEADVFILYVGYDFLNLYLEPGDHLIVEQCSNGKFRFDGEQEAVARNLLLDTLRQERKKLYENQRRINFAKKMGKDYSGEVLDPSVVYTTCEKLIADFEQQGEGCTDMFCSYLHIDQKYFKIATSVSLPPYLNKTYHAFTPSDLNMLSAVVTDARANEATLSSYYRQMARAYMDYLRIEDPEHKMGLGEDYLQNELRLGNYFGEGEVADMLRAFNLDMIGYQHAGDSMYRKTVECLPMKWQTGLTDYFTPRTEVKGRKISVAVDYPEIEGETPEGKRVSLKDFAGKWVFVDCWATWCGPCNFEIPFLGHLEHALEGENIVFLGISVDVEKDREKWKAFIQEKGLGGIQILCKDKQELYNQFGISGIPHFALIDPTGRLVMNKMPHPSTGVPHHLLKAMVK